MGLISDKCCKYKQNEDLPKNLQSAYNNSKRQFKKLASSRQRTTENTESGNRRVTFSNFVEQRNIHCQEEKEYANITYEDIQRDPVFCEIKDDELVTNISFENSENHFVIEDCYYKFPHKMPRTVDDLSFVEEKEQNLLKTHIQHAVQSVMTTNNRIDGILYLHHLNALLILTEFNIYEYEKNENKFELTKVIPIQEIDFITITRDAKKVILHLVLERTYIIHSNDLDKLVACVCATYFYDKTGQDINNNRQISVIVLNENFNIIPTLELKSDFSEYK
jgi:hypothetical protein